MSDPKRIYGCCADKSCTPATCMRLPDGMTCNECLHFLGTLVEAHSCSRFLNRNLAETSCDWFPRRFKPVEGAEDVARARVAPKGLASEEKATQAFLDYVNAPSVPSPGPVHGKLIAAENSDGPDGLVLTVMDPAGKVHDFKNCVITSCSRGSVAEGPFAASPIICLESVDIVVKKPSNTTMHLDRMEIPKSLFFGDNENIVESVGGFAATEAGHVVELCALMTNAKEVVKFLKCTCQPDLGKVCNVCLLRGYIDAALIIVEPMKESK